MQSSQGNRPASAPIDLAAYRDRRLKRLGNGYRRTVPTSDNERSRNHHTPPRPSSRPTLIQIYPKPVQERIALSQNEAYVLLYDEMQKDPKILEDHEPTPRLLFCFVPACQNAKDEVHYLERFARAGWFAFQTRHAGAPKIKRIPFDFTQKSADKDEPFRALYRALYDKAPTDLAEVQALYGDPNKAFVHFISDPCKLPSMQ